MEIVTEILIFLAKYFKYSNKILLRCKD